MDPSLPDTDLERLLAQLLRTVSPAAVGGALGPGPVAGTRGGRPADKQDTGGAADSVGTPAAERAGGPGPDLPAAGFAAGPRPNLPAAERAGGPGADLPAAERASGPGPDLPAAEFAGGPRPNLPAVSTSEARALIELLAARGIAQGQLAALLGLEKSTVSRLAAGLERKGWLRRGRDQRNQRYIRLYLTPAGTELASQVWRAWQSRQARILASLSAEERAGLAAGLRGLVRGLAAEGLLSDPGHRHDPGR
jgi:DNA-binding MarR family transcriptional regulator